MSRSFCINYIKSPQIHERIQGTPPLMSPFISENVLYPMQSFWYAGGRGPDDLIQLLSYYLITAKIHR